MIKDPEYLDLNWIGRFYEVKAFRSHDLQSDSSLSDIEKAKRYCRSQFSLLELFERSAKIHVFYNSERKALDDMLK